MINTRDITEKDVPIVVDLARQCHVESNYSALIFDPEVVTTLAESMLLDPSVRFCRVAEKENKIFAMYAGFISQYIFSKDLMASDLLLYVEPSKRGTLAAVKLMKEFEMWAFDNGALEIRPAVTTGIKIEKTKKLHEILGYTTSGHTFIKRRQYV